MCLFLEKEQNIYKILIPGSIQRLRYPSWTRITLELGEFEHLRTMFDTLQAIARDGVAAAIEENQGFKIGMVPPPSPPPPLTRC